MEMIDKRIEKLYMKKLKLDMEKMKGNKQTKGRRH